MSAENYFVLMQQTKSLSRVAYMNFIYENKPDLPSSIFAWLFEKSIDLVDGIIKLYKSNLSECSQALIRVLFETHLKYIHIVNLMTTLDRDEVSKFIIESIVLLKEKSTLKQDEAFPNAELTEKLGDIDSLKKKYQDESNPFIASLRNHNFLKHDSCIKAIKKNGFLLDSIESISKKYNKNNEYQIMYRNFSRNVHANDLVEYFVRQGHSDDKNTIQLRDVAALHLVLRIFLEMMTHMNHLFCLDLDEQLEEIQKKYVQIS